MAAGYCTQELEQAATQLLPPEIIAEIGVADDDNDAMNSAAVIEGLATHLASILGLAGVTTQHRSRPANATPHDQRHVSSVTTTVKNDMVLCPGTVKMFATPMAPPPAASTELLLPERRRNGSGTGVFLPVRHRSGTGTGVFMPLAGAYSTRPFKSSRSRASVKPPRLMRKEAHVEMPMAMRLQDDNAAVFQARPQLPVLP